MPKAVFFGEFQEGKRVRGAPRKHYKDHLKRQLAQGGNNHQPWQQEALDWDSSRSSVRKASHNSEAERREAAKERHRTQNEQAVFQSFSAQTFACPKCKRVCAWGIWLCWNQWAGKNLPSTFKKSSSTRNQPSSKYNSKTVCAVKKLQTFQEANTEIIEYGSISISTQTCTCTHIHMHTCTYVHTHTHTHTHTHNHTHTHTHTQSHTHTHMYMCVYTHHTHTNACAHTHMNKCAYVCASLPSPPPHTHTEHSTSQMIHQVSISN